MYCNVVLHSMLNKHCYDSIDSNTKSQFGATFKSDYRGDRPQAPVCLLGGYLAKAILLVHFISCQSKLLALVLSDG